MIEENEKPDSKETGLENKSNFAKASQAGIYQDFLTSGSSGKLDHEQCAF